jgi:hypothetical protein
MKLKFIILSIVFASLLFGQDGKQIDSVKNTVEPSALKKRKRKKLKKVHIANTIQNAKAKSLTNKENDNSSNPLLIPILIFTGGLVVILISKQLLTNKKTPNQYNYFKNEYIKSIGWTRNGENNPEGEKLLRELNSLSDRQVYYRYEYLQSEAWKRKRYVVLKRDNWCCVYCGSQATQVHHTKYAKFNIGKEPIEWLVSVCKTCHKKQHS